MAGATSARGAVPRRGPDPIQRLPEATRLRVRRLDVPLSAPFGIAFDEITDLSALVAHASDGDRHGFGEATPLASVTGEDRDDVLSDLGAWQQAGGGDLDQLRTPAGRAAVDGALLDLAARREQVPLARLLGASDLGPVPTSATVPLGGDGLDDRLDRILEQGFSILKIKAGGAGDDLERLRQVRERVGRSPTLRVDPNQGWTRPEALDALDTLEDLDVELLEQPLPEEDLAGHAMLREQTTVPVMLDESVATVGDVEEIAEAEAADMVNIKLMKTGGPRAGLALADGAEAAGMTCMVGCMIESRVGIAQAAHLFHAHDAIEVADLDGAIFLAGDPVDGGPRLEGGAVQVPDRPGSAIREVDAGETLDEIEPCRR